MIQIGARLIKNDQSFKRINLLEVKKQELISQILHSINKSNNFSNLIYEIVSLIKEFTQIQAIAIRLKQDNDYPYFYSIGFPKYFIKRENSLLPNDQTDLFNSRGLFGNIQLDCICGKVLDGRIDKTNEFITNEGSFWTNSTTLLLNSINPQDKLINRNECNRAGYESVAIIPIKISDDKRIGLLQLNDKRKDVFNEELIQFFEDLCETIGLAIQIKNKEEELLFQTKTLDHKNKLLNVIYKCGQTLNRYDLSENEIYFELFKIFKEISYIPKLAGLYFEIEEHKFSSDQFTKTKQVLRKKINVNGNNFGKIEFYFDEDSEVFNDKLYIDELKNFLTTIVSNLQDYFKQHRYEKIHKQSEMRFNTIWQNSYDAMRLTNSKGIMIAVNDSFCKLVNMELHELVGKHYLYIYEEDTKQALENKIINKFSEKNSKYLGPFKKEVILKSKVKLQIEISFSIIKWVDDDNLTLAIFKDITEKVRLEEERKNNEKLATIGKLASFLTHEIKSYLNPMKMTIGYLSKNIKFSDNEFSYFKMLGMQVERLEHLVKETLEFAKQNDIHQKEINLFSLIESLKLFFKQVLEQKEIEFTNNINPKIILEADYEKLQGIFLHIIENSIEASDNKSKIEIMNELDPTKKCVYIRIKDEGKGIKEGSKIFEPFVTTKSSGTGLGLPIAKKYLEMHKAEIKLLNSEKGNTVFEIIFPWSGVKDGHNSNY